LARKILLADDSVTAQNMGRKILADAGYEVITVNNGSAALKKIAEAKPEIIVLDVYMPGYSGLEVCQRLKESNDTARIPVLLTVGKLEPFKPEEARRVRAEGFIVKPFEASELLSALTKLEDKIVPRSDSSKPGRFARAIAAVEEGRYDKSVAIDEDSGWRSRISFPRKKKEKPVEPEDGDDPAIYNAVNRDLKTVIEHKLEHAPQPVQQASGPQEPAHVDLGALVAHGLPKDVTAEEIAALAAAAAQVQGISESEGSKDSNAAPASAPEFRHEEAKKSEETSLPQTEATHAPSEEINAAPSAAQPVPAAESAEVPVMASSEAKAEEAPKVEAREATNEPAAIAEKTSHEVAATFAPEGQEKKEDGAPETKTIEVAKDEDEAEAGSSAAEALPTIASFATADVVANSGNETSASASSKVEEPEPIAMAVATVQIPVVSRWTAVGVALAAEEASISLEEEMRKAEVAAVALRETAPVAVEERAMEEPVEATDKAPVAPSPAAELEPASEAVTATLTTAETVNEDGQTAVTPATPVVKEFESITPREPEPSPADIETPAESQSTVAPVIAEAAEVPSAGAAVAEGTTEEKQPESESVAVINSGSLINEVTPEAVSSPTLHEASDSNSDRETAAPRDSKLEEVAPAEELRADQQEPEAALSAEISVTQAPEQQISQESAEPAAAVKQEISGGIPDMAKKESEIAANTAAAWASWRRIRETDGNGAENGAEKESQHAGSAREEAAMAVAAGAEKAPEEGSGDAEVSPEIASIVDSVLADLRPKIVEEISRKLKKKK